MKFVQRSAVVAIIGFSCAGCLVNSHTDTEQTGSHISPETLRQIEPGKTERSWVFAVLGPPTETIAVDAATEIWRYAYTETKTSQGSVFLIFRGSDKKVTNSSVFVEMKNGVVSRTWNG